MTVVLRLCVAVSEVLLSFSAMVMMFVFVLMVDAMQLPLLMCLLGNVMNRLRLLMWCELTVMLCVILLLAF